MKQESINKTDNNITRPIPPKTPKGIDHKRTVQLYNQGLGAPTIAKIQGCTASNITQVLARYYVEQDRVEQFKSNRADIFAGLQDRLLTSITPEEIKKAPLGTRVLAAAQLYDKERLERGQSTQIVDLKGKLASITGTIKDLESMVQAFSE